MKIQEEESLSHCYCESTALDTHMFTCDVCKLKFHVSCLRSGKPTDLVGDIYFKFTCAKCSPDGEEDFKRVELKWTTVLILALYNLQLQGGGKCGHFRWKEICRFVAQHWNSFFGENRSKSGNWHGTISGCLSNGTNRFFLRGDTVLGEKGWWTLKSQILPSLEEIEDPPQSAKQSRKRRTEVLSSIVEGPRKKKSNILEAALSLKEKQSTIVEDCPPKVKRKSHSKSDIFPPNHKIKLIVPKPETFQSTSGGDSSTSVPNVIIKTEPSPKPEEPISHWLKESIDLNLSIHDLPSIFDLPAPLESSSAFTSLLEDVFTDISCDKFSLKPSPVRNESEEENSNSEKLASSLKKQQHIDTSHKKKAITKDESPIKENVILDSKFTLMSPPEEENLLMRLEAFPNAMKERPDLRRLYRKLVVRKLKRERNLPVFDIDAEVRTIRGMDPPEYLEKNEAGKFTKATNARNSILDRYQINFHNVRNKSIGYSSFITRLMGIEDEEQESIISPYTERILKPFIFRDYSTKPLKLQLLEELMQRSNKSNPDFVPPKQSPIDYCYVRPQHIPPINALCHEYFWPGIDLSETLQYPDFSCVALYRKVVVGFAFMIPDVKYNEAYITFVFCHPEWRRAGIATFMIYHLIQTCMGKDITLHVSATSSAVHLYGKFGFKVEEFVRDYYDKYLPPESKECRHALFLRLRH